MTRRPFVFGAVAVGAALIALGPIADGDVYWHVAAGHEMWTRGALLRTDPFTSSAAGRSWIDVHWLFQLAVARLHGAFGMAGLAVAKALAVAAGATLATRAAERGGGDTARDACAVVTLGLLFLARHLLPVRPILVTLLCLAAFLLVLEALRVGAARRGALIAVPLLQLIWVNCQGLAPLGPALVGCYLIGALSAPATTPERRTALPLALTLASCLLASFATPYGLAAVALPARLFGRITPGDNIFSSAIAENIPPFILDRTSPEMTAHLRAVLIVAAAALVLLRPPLPLAHVLALGVFGALALMANRNIVLFYWVLAPIGAIAVASSRAVLLAGRARTRIALAVALACELGAAGIALAHEPRIGTPTPFHFPTESARMLAAAGASGALFAPDHDGGYLELAVPALRPYIDTRLILHSGREYADYLALFDEPPLFDALDAREHFRYVVLTTANPDRYLGLISHLASSPAWRLLYTDGFEVLFGREGEGLNLGDQATVAGVATGLDRRYAALPEARAAARLDLARLLIVVGHPSSALGVLDALASRPAAELRARAQLAAGDLGAAEALARVLLLSSPDDVRSLTLLAEIAVARQTPDDARRYLARALAVDPYDPEARGVLARLEQQSHGRPSRAHES
ncbi:MAG: tetratricopeptide repeat protein [Polyangia bacterium]